MKADVLDPKVAKKLLDCDYLFLAADTMRARLLINAIAHQYLIPAVRVGSKVVHDKDSGAITGVQSLSTRCITVGPRGESDGKR